MTGNKNKGRSGCLYGRNKFIERILAFLVVHVLRKTAAHLLKMETKVPGEAQTVVAVGIDQNGSRVDSQLLAGKTRQQLTLESV